MNEQIYRFSALANAQSFANAMSSMRIMLGDDGRFWVVTPATAQRLERGGYEYA